MRNCRCTLSVFYCLAPVRYVPVLGGTHHVQLLQPYLHVVTNVTAVGH